MRRPVPARARARGRLPREARSRRLSRHAPRPARARRFSAPPGARARRRRSTRAPPPQPATRPRTQNCPSAPHPPPAGRRTGRQQPRSFAWRAPLAAARFHAISRRGRARPPAAARPPPHAPGRRHGRISSAQSSPRGRAAAAAGRQRRGGSPTAAPGAQRQRTGATQKSCFFCIRARREATPPPPPPPPRAPPGWPPARPMRSPPRSRGAAAGALAVALAVGVVRLVAGHFVGGRRHRAPARRPPAGAANSPQACTRPPTTARPLPCHTPTRPRGRGARRVRLAARILGRAPAAGRRSKVRGAAPNRRGCPFVSRATVWGVREGECVNGRDKPRARARAPGRRFGGVFFFSARAPRRAGSQASLVLVLHRNRLVRKKLDLRGQSGGPRFSVRREGPARLWGALMARADLAEVVVGAGGRPGAMMLRDEVMRR